jgi:hypothetical protein
MGNTKWMWMVLLLAFSPAVPAQKKGETYAQYRYGVGSAGTEFTLTFQKGKAFNHPLFAVWLADAKGDYVETLYVSQSIGKGVFPRVNRATGHWKEGAVQRPAALPYWAHQRNLVNEFGTVLPTPAHPVVDGITGATPQGSFVLHLRTATPLQGTYRVLLELNQSWDWNAFWYNDRFPADPEYKTSSQPALVYSVEVTVPSAGGAYALKPIGHSHYSGADGSLNPDLSTLTTALQIARRITVSLP